MSENKFYFYYSKRLHISPSSIFQLQPCYLLDSGDGVLEELLEGGAEIVGAKSSLVITIPTASSVTETSPPAGPTLFLLL